MRPGIAAVDGEIVGVGDAAPLNRLGFEELVGNAVALAIGDRFLGTLEAQLHLLTHVARARPAHQRLDLARLFRLVLEHPFLGLGRAGLHRGPRGLVDACDHGLSLARASKYMVGAAGFEPATWSTQNSRATRLRYAPAPSRRASIHGSVCASKPRRIYRLPRKIACPTRSPGAMPSFLAVPPITSSTARTGPLEDTSASESGTLFSAMLRMRPSPR